MSTIYSADTRIGRNVSYFMKLLTQAGLMCTLVKAYFWLTFPVGFFFMTLFHTQLTQISTNSCYMPVHTCQIHMGNVNQQCDLVVIHSTPAYVNNFIFKCKTVQPNHM